MKVIRHDNKLMQGVPAFAPDIHTEFASGGVPKLPK